MTHEAWIEKLDAYLDGELTSAETLELDRHLRECSACAVEALRRLQWKQAIKSAGQRYSSVGRSFLPAQIQRSVGRTFLSAPGWWRPAAVALAVISIVAAATIYRENVRQTRNNQFLSELIDLHVSTLASANPVDVVSTDRHTVKPWFAGKIPFTFDLPELQGTPFELVGGRVTYLEQAPGAELLFGLRQHRITVLIFQEKALPQDFPTAGPMTSQSFHLQTFKGNGLRYFVIGDVAAEDIQTLSHLLKSIP